MDNKQLMFMKKEVVATTNTRGWYFILKIAEDTVTAIERSALDEDDDAKATVLRRQARAAREFYNNFLQAVESTKHVEAPEHPTELPDDDFYDVNM